MSSTLPFPFFSAPIQMLEVSSWFGIVGGGIHLLRGFQVLHKAVGEKPVF